MNARKRTREKPATEERPPLSRKEYEAELERLHVELVKLQRWVVHAGLKVCIVFEGRDTAGKGGTIKAITERVSPRVFRVVALPAPTEREKSQMYVQRYIRHFPSAGEVVIFDRSWYNRAGVERVMGFTTEKDVKRFLDVVPPSRRRWWNRASCSSSTGSRSAPMSRPGGSKRASTTAARPGSCLRWTSSPTAGGSTTHARVTT
jgi:polyphosphate kinase 2 (PPK2 family)